MQFGDIIGQKELGSKLRQGVMKGRVPHAQLFLGQEGSGNLALALAYARYLSCTNRTESDSCGECNSCKKYQSYTHPDLHFSFPFTANKGKVASELYPEWRKTILANPYMNYEMWMGEIGAENKQGNIPVKECHAIIHSLSLKPFESQWKVLLMWMPEFLGSEGNILLKLLEEPTPGTVFLLVGGQSDKILTTILSRVQLVRVPPVMPEDISRALEEQFQKPSEEANRISMLASGNYLRAQELAANTENQFLEPFRNWMLLCYAKNMAGIASWVDEYGGSGREQLKSFFLYGLEIIRASLVEPFISGKSGLSPQEQEFVSKFSKIVSVNGKVQSMYDWINDAAYEIERNGNPRIILTDLSFKLARILK